jgi:hypothetical protein
MTMRKHVVRGPDPFKALCRHTQRAMGADALVMLGVWPPDGQKATELRIATSIRGNASVVPARLRYLAQQLRDLAAALEEEAGDPESMASSFYNDPGQN